MGSKKRLLIGLLISSVVLNSVLWTLVFSLFDQSNPTAVLHYSVAVGIDFVGEGSNVVILPLIGSLLLLFNGVAGIVLYRTEPRLSWVLWGMMPVLQLTLLGSFLLLLRFNSGGNGLNYPI